VPCFSTSSPVDPLNLDDPPPLHNSLRLGPGILPSGEAPLHLFFARTRPLCLIGDLFLLLRKSEDRSSISDLDFFPLRLPCLRFLSFSPFSDG